MNTTQSQEKLENEYESAALTTAADSYNYNYIYTYHSVRNFCVIV